MIGNHAVIAPVESNPSRLSRLPSWNTQVTMPSAAATDSTFRRIALIGITIERNVISSSRNAIAKTNANTYQMRDDISSLKSTEPAVKPATPTTLPLDTPPNTSGTTSSRSVFTASIERSSVPVPASGTSTTASSPSRLTSTVTGSWNWSESRANWNTGPTAPHT